MTRRRKAWIALLVVALVLIALRAIAPFAATAYLNRTLADLGDYRGHLDDIDLALWHGAYTLHGLDVAKKDETGAGYRPFVELPMTEISLSWSALFDGEIAGEVEFHSPRLNFIDSPGEDEDQVGAGVDWRETLQQLLPVQIDEIHVYDGAIHFLNPTAEPRVDVFIDALNATISNVSNADRREGTQVAHLQARGEIMGGAPIEATADFDPLRELTDFDFDLRALGIDVTQLDDFMRAYAGIDAEDGRADVVMELTADRRQLDGYFKLLLRDLDVFEWQADVENDEVNNPLRLAWEGLVGGVMQLLSNPPRDQFAFRAPISGSIEALDAGVWATISSVLRNAFVEALQPRLESAPDEDVPLDEATEARLDAASEGEADAGAAPDVTDRPVGGSARVASPAPAPDDADSAAGDEGAGNEGEAPSPQADELGAPDLPRRGPTPPG